MRPIKFRAKTTANGHWVYGSLIDYGDGTFAIRNSKSQPWVQAETIGQFTGLKDRNGTEIYEGDIIEHCAQVYDFGAVWSNVWVKYRQSDCEFVGMDIFRRTKDRRETWRPLRRCVSKCVVLGNIHDNPELL